MSPEPVFHQGQKSQAEPLQLRVHGHPTLPTLVYLPGLHGDWTLAGSIRAALKGQARFAEFTYPRTLDWSLNDYARAAANLLVQAGIPQAWILAESFGSQIAWPLVAHPGPFTTQGLILAGGFGRYPIPILTSLGARITARLPLKWFHDPLRFYAWIARWRFRDQPEVLQDIDEFISRRTHPDRLAAVHRLRLIAANHPETLAQQVTCPVYYVSGLLDPVVPWPFVPKWLRRHCPTFAGWHLVLRADHNVLATGTATTARHILRWMQPPSPTAPNQDPHPVGRVVPSGAPSSSRLL